MTIVLVVLGNPNSAIEVGTLAVIIAATDSPPTLPRVLDAIRAGAAVPDELIVVREPGGLGPAAARNLGVARTDAAILVFVDADVVPARDAIERLRDRLAGDPGLTAVFGAYDDAPEARNLVSRFRNLLHHHVHVNAAGTVKTFWTGLGAVRRDAFDAVGGFDSERFERASIEDVELGARLDRAGGRILLDPEICGTHLKRWTLGSMFRTDLERRGVPWVRLLLAEGVPAPSIGGPKRALFSLLARSGGVPLALAGVPLLALHFLAAVLAVPVGAVAHLRSRRAPTT